MANGGTIQFGIKYNVDQSSLNNIKKNLQEMQRMTTAAFSNVNKTGITNAGQELGKVKQTAQDVENALERAFNPNLNTYNLTQLNRELNKIGIDKIYNDFQKMGTAGQSAFRGIVTQIATTNQQLKQSHKLIDDFAKTMGNTIKWGITSSIMNTFTGSVEKAYGYVKNLDSSLNDIRIVTNQSAEEMDKFAVKANNAAKALGSSTLDYTKASLIYYQQGLSEQEVEARANVTLKAANVTGQSGEAVSEQLTAIWNGYKVSAEEAEVYIDKVSAVAAATAADLEELSTGMSKVASAANAMGVDVDQLNAQLATIVSVTRQAPESVGTALKTIYARMSDLKLGETDEDGLGLGDVSGTMESMGIEVLDATGNLRDMGNVIEDVAAKWDTWTEAQQTAMAQVMAGKRQYNNLVALFENWDMYTDALETSENATGTLAQQNEIYLESVEAHLQQLSTATEDLYDSLFNAESFKDLIDFGTNAINIFGDFIDSIGGGGTALTALGGIATRVFSKNIAEGLQTTIANLKVSNSEIEKVRLQTQFLQQTMAEMNRTGKNDAVVTKVVDQKMSFEKYNSLMTPEMQGQVNQGIQNYSQALDQQDIFKKNKQAAEDYLRTIRSLGPALIDLGDSAIDEQQDTFRDALVEVDTALENLIGTTGQYREAIGSTFSKGEIQSVLKDMRNSFKNLSSTVKVSEEDTKRYYRAMNKLAAAMKEGNPGKQRVAYNQLNSVIRGLSQSYSEASKNASRFVEMGGSRVGNEMAQLANQTQVAKQQLDTLKQKLSEISKIQALTNVIGSIGQIASAIQSISALPDIWENNDLTESEKWLQTITSISFSLPMLINGFSALFKAGGQAVSVLQSGLAIVTNQGWMNLASVLIKENSLLIKLLPQFGAKILLKKAEQKIDEETLKTELTKHGLYQANMTKEQMLLVAKNNGLLTSIGLTEAEAGAIMTADAAQKKFNLSALANPYLIAGAGIVAAIVVVVMAVKMANKAYDEAVEKSEKAAKALENLTQAYKDANNALSQLQSDISAYKESQKAIDELTIGTEEWKNAISDANKEVLNLMNNYSGLSQYITNENGRLIVSEEGFSAIEAQKQQAVSESYQAKVLADLMNLQAKSDLATIKTRRDIDVVNEEIVSGAASGAGALTGAIGGGIVAAKLGTQIGAAIGTTIAPGVGTAIGVGIGAIGGAAIGAATAAIAEAADDIHDEDVKAVTEAYQLFGESIFTDATSLKLALEEVGHSINDLQANALIQNSEALLSLSESVKANTDAQKIQKQQILDTEFQDNLTYQNSEFKDEITQFFVKQLDESSAEYKKAQEKTKEKGAAQQQEEYAALMGWSTTNVKEEDGAYVFSLADGTTQTIDKELLEATLTQNELLSMMEEQMSTVADNMTSIAQIENNGVNIGEGLLSFSGGQGGDLTGITDKELAALDDKIRNGNQEELTQIANDLGYQGDEALNDFLKHYEIALQQRYNQELATFSKLKSSLQNLYYESFETDFLEDLDIENKNKAINLLNDSFIRLGQDGFEFIGGVLADNTDKADEFFDALDSADWSSTQGVIDLEQKLNQLGIEIDYTSKGWSNFKESMRGTAVFDSATTALEGLRSKLAQIEELTGDIEIGSIISDKAYQDLLLLNPELEKFFLLTSQGYQFAGMGTGEGTLSDYLKSDVLGEDLQTTLDNAEKANNLALSFTEKQGQYGTFKEAAEKYSYGVSQAYVSGPKAFLKTLSEEQLQSIKVSRDSIDALSDTEIESYIAQIDDLISRQKAGEFGSESITELFVSEIESLEKLDKAFQKGGISAEKYAKKRSILINKELKELDVAEEEFENYVKRIKDTNEELAKQPHLVDALALAYYKLNNGVKDINDNWEVWQNKISKGSEEEKAQVYQQQKKAVSNVLNYDLDELMGEDNANQFIESEEGQKAIYNIGVAVDEESKKKAIDDLRDLTIQREVEILIKAQGLDPNEKGGAAEKIQQFANALQDANSKLKFGDKLPEELKSHLQTMIDDTTVAASTIVSLLASAGFASAELEGIQNFQFKDFGNATANEESRKSLYAQYGINYYSDQATLENLKKAMIQDLVGSDKLVFDFSYSGTDLDTTATGEDDIGDKDKWEKDTNLKDTEKKAEVEYDRYHDVNIEIQKQVDLLDKLQNEEDKLVGQAYLDNLEQQNIALEEQNKWIEEKIKLKKEEAAELREALELQGMEFDEEGDISNYLSKMKGLVEKIDAAQAEVNEANQAYNDATSKEAEKTAQDRIDFAQGELDKLLEQYEWLKELIEKYEQIQHEDLVQLEFEKEANINKQIENEIKSLNYSIDVDLDLADAERQWNEFKWKVLEKGTRFSLFGDDILGEAEMLMQNLQTYPESINGLMNQVQKYMGIINSGGQFKAGANMEDAIENAEKYRDELMAAMESVEDAIQQIQQLYLDMIDSAKDAFDDHIAQYELVNEILEHNISLIEKLDGEDSFDAMGKYYEEMEQNNNANLAFQREQVEFWKQRMEAEEYGSEAWLKYKENWQSAMSELNSTVEASVDNLIAKYQNTVSSIMADLSKSLAGNDFGLDYLEEEWNLLNENADFYLDRVNSMFAIDELQSKYMDAINNTDNLKAQEQLTKIMNEQVAALEEKGKLTEYDVERANLLYEIELKKIALEEAQQNKSKMRLRRDSQGNYSYQFTADEDAIAQTQNELDKLQNSLYNLDKEAYRNNLNEVLRIQQEYQDKIAELFMDQTLTAEEREAKIADLKQYYGSLVNKNLEENAVIRANLEESTFAAMADTQEQIIMGEMVPQWDSGVQKMIDAMVAEGGFGPTVHDTLENLRESHTDYEKSLQEMADAAGIDLDAIRGGYDTVHEGVEQLIEQSEGELMNTWNEQLNKMSALVDSLADYDDALENTRQAVRDLIDELNKLIAKQKEADGGTVTSDDGSKDDGGNKPTNEGNKPTTETPSNDGGTKGDSGGGDALPKTRSLTDDIKWGVAAAIHYAPTAGWGNGAERLSKFNEKFGGNETVLSNHPIQKIINQWYEKKDTNTLEKFKKYYDKIDDYKYSAFDTGGYTGQWGSEGKMAMLHEKELVLNKQDTENLLAAVDIVRTITGVIDNLERKVSARMFDLSNLNIPQYAQPIQDAQTIEQQVHIDATFPNVQNSNEIEEAFNNLVNRATQYAFRNKR